MPPNRQEVGAAVFAREAAEVQHREYAIVERLWAFAKASGKALQSLSYPEILSERPFEKSVRVMFSTFESEKKLKD